MLHRLMLAIRPRTGRENQVRPWVMIPLAAVLGLGGVLAAVVLYGLIGLFAHIFYFHQFTFAYVEPHSGSHASSPLTIAILVFGALCSGLAIKYGDISLRGHGIPEVMEAVLQRESRIKPRVALLKPVLAALSIGTGSPFGAEGPIIQTSGALGSLLGQWIPVSAVERKILLGCGAAAGMTGIFATPMAAVLLALELVVFEFSGRAIIPIAVAAAVTDGLRLHMLPGSPLFPSTASLAPGVGPLLWVAVFGILAGLLGSGITWVLYALEDVFAWLPRTGLVTRPIIGAIAVGLIALGAPSVLGTGYDLIRSVLAGGMPTGQLLALCFTKGIGWLIALASGTVGGVLAPLFLVAGSSGELVGRFVQPLSHVDPALVALLFMSAIFAAGSRAVLTAAIFAVEVTGDYAALVPVMIAVMVGTAVAGRLLGYNIMTGKLVRRGLRPPLDYFAPAFLKGRRARLRPRSAILENVAARAAQPIDNAPIPAREPAAAD